MVDYISLWNAQESAGNLQKEIFHDDRSFWGDPKNARRFLDRLFYSDISGIEHQFAVFQTPPGLVIWGQVPELLCAADCASVRGVAAGDRCRFCAG